MKKDSLMDIPHAILEEAMKTGVNVSEDETSGVFFHVDQNTIYSKVGTAFMDQVEMMDTKDALEKYPWLEEYRWQLVDPEKDEYTKTVHEEWSGGYFMRIKKGAKVTFPLQSCLMITGDKSEQKVHNIIIAEEGSDCNILTTCAQHSGAQEAAHYGISEIYVKKDAKLTFTMVHHWAEDTKVRPRTAINVEEDAEFVSNYICLSPAKDVQMFPKAVCAGENSKAVFNSILYVQEDNWMDIGSWTVLEGKNSNTELNTRAICRKNSTLISRGTIEGNHSESRGHLECRGLLLDDEAVLEAIPILRATKMGAELSHEAAVGKLNQGEITYLMSRKLSEDQAIGILIRGFMDVSIMGLSPAIKEEIDKIVDLVADAS